MKKYDKINSFQRINANLWKRGRYYFRLFANGVTPNECWLINPRMVELKDIEISSGNDVYGCRTIFLGQGSVQKGLCFLRFL